MSSKVQISDAYDDPVIKIIDIVATTTHRHTIAMVDTRPPSYRDMSDLEEHLYSVDDMEEVKKTMETCKTALLRQNPGYDVLPYTETIEDVERILQIMTETEASYVRFV